MNYSFYEKHIGDVSEDLLQKLIALAMRLSYQPHTDFHERSMLIAGVDFYPPRHSETRELVTRSPLSKWFNPMGLKNISIDRIPARTYLPEHSDTVSKVNVQNFHKVHVPLITNDKVAFMWRVPGTTKGHTMQMHAGGLWIYNNIAQHCVLNLGVEPRYHMILRYNEGSELQPLE